MRSRPNNNLRLYACQVKDEHIRLSLPAWAQGRTDEQHFRYSSYSLEEECGRQMASSATWRETSNPRLTSPVGLVGTAAMRELHVIQGPNCAWCAWKNCVLYIPHILSVRLTNWAKIESKRNYTTAANLPIFPSFFVYPNKYFVNLHLLTLLLPFLSG